MTIRVPARYELSGPEDAHALGRSLAAAVRPGDVLLLVGDLGAGKTTLTQGIGAGLRVRGDVTSPTFVISRVHPPLGEGPALVHVDAYRLGDRVELDDLDLDAYTDTAVTVVEWGRGVAEQLSDSRLEIEIQRATDGPAEYRVVTLTGVGPRWNSPGADPGGNTGADPG